MSLNIQNNVAMPQNQMTFKGKEQIIKGMTKEGEEKLNSALVNTYWGQYKALRTSYIKGQIVGFIYKGYSKLSDYASKFKEIFK